MLNVTRGGAVETHRMSPDSKTILRSGRLGHKAKGEYFRALYERYRKAGREAKRVMLNEFCWNTGYKPEICDSSCERTCWGEASGAAATKTTAALWPARALHPGRGAGKRQDIPGRCG